MSSNPLGGSLGYNIWSEQEPKNNQIQNLGSIGNPSNLNNAAGAEVRGTTSFNLSNGEIDFDFYQGQASWWRPALAGNFDDTPVSAGLNFSVFGGDDAISGFVVSVWDAAGNLIFSGFDFLIGDGAADLFGADGVQQLEAADTDFVSSIHNPLGAPSGIDWSYAPTVGFAANTFVVGVAGFSINMDGTSDPLAYTMNWAFG
jgi:hypothetical protein